MNVKDLADTATAAYELLTQLPPTADEIADLIRELELTATGPDPTQSALAHFIRSQVHCPEGATIGAGFAEVYVEMGKFTLFIDAPDAVYDLLADIALDGKHKDLVTA